MIAPVDLGQALADPGIYMQWPAQLAAPDPAPRVRRPRRARRKVAALAAVVAAAGLAVAGWGAGVHAAQRRAWGVVSGGAK